MDDVQRVNALSKLSPKHGFSLFLAKLGLRVRRESHEEPTGEFFEIKGVVNLDATTVLDKVSWSSSQVVQSNLSNVFNTANTSSITSNSSVGLLHVDYRL